MIRLIRAEQLHLRGLRSTYVTAVAIAVLGTLIVYADFSDAGTEGMNTDKDLLDAFMSTMALIPAIGPRALRRRPFGGGVPLRHDRPQGACRAASTRPDRREARCDRPLLSRRQRCHGNGRSPRGTRRHICRRPAVAPERGLGRRARHRIDALRLSGSSRRLPGSQPDGSGPGRVRRMGLREAARGVHGVRRVPAVCAPRRARPGRARRRRRPGRPRCMPRSPQRPPC